MIYGLTVTLMATLVGMSPPTDAMVGVWSASGSLGGDFGWSCDRAFDAHGRYAESCYPEKSDVGSYRVLVTKTRGIELIRTQRVYMHQKAEDLTTSITLDATRKKVTENKIVWTRQSDAVTAPLAVVGRWSVAGEKDGWKGAWEFGLTGTYVHRDHSDSGTVQVLSRKANTLRLRLTPRTGAAKELEVVTDVSGHALTIEGKRHVRFLER